MFRQVVLAVGENTAVSNVIHRYGRRIGINRFVAGEHLSDAVDVIKTINRDGIMVTVDRLGESVRDVSHAVAAGQQYYEILEAIQAHRLNASISVKLTLLGLKIDYQKARAHLEGIVKRAHAYGRFVRIDMEDSSVTSATLALYREVAEQYPESIGAVLQAYLYRTSEDLAKLRDYSCNLRIVKGAYREPESVAFPSKPDVDEKYYEITTEGLAQGHYIAIATHDERMIGRLLRYINTHGISRSQFEFQMLYGIKYHALKELQAEGYRTRVYLPYGEDWYAYYLRRIAERPANLLFVLKALRG